MFYVYETKLNFIREATNVIIHGRKFVYNYELYGHRRQLVNRIFYRR